MTLRLSDDCSTRRSAGHGSCGQCGRCAAERNAHRERRAHLLAAVAGILSRHVGAVAAMECANNAMQAAVHGVTLTTALDSAMLHRRAHPALYPAWELVTDGDVLAMLRRVEEVLPC